MMVVGILREDRFSRRSSQKDNVYSNDNYSSCVANIWKSINLIWEFRTERSYVRPGIPYVTLECQCPRLMFDFPLLTFSTLAFAALACCPPNYNSFCPPFGRRRNTENLILMAQSTISSTSFVINLL